MRPIALGRRGLSRLDRMLMGSETSRVLGHGSLDVLVVPRDTAIGRERVLLATDGSKHSEAAADKSMEFAKRHGADWTAVAVVESNEEFYSLAPEDVERLIDKSREALEGVRKKAEAAGLKAEAVVKDGVMYKGIVETASEKSAGAIFMGNHGRTGVKKLLMGSVTEKVIGHATSPVFVVKP